MFTIAAGMLIAFCVMWLASLFLIGFFTWFFRDSRNHPEKAPAAPDDIALAALARWREKHPKVSSLEQTKAM